MSQLEERAAAVVAEVRAAFDRYKREGADALPGGLRVSVRGGPLSLDLAVFEALAERLVPAGWRYRVEHTLTDSTLVMEHYTDPAILNPPAGVGCRYCYDADGGCPDCRPRFERKRPDDTEGGTCD